MIFWHCMLMMSAVFTEVFSRAAPISEDICNLPQIIGPCKASKERFYYNIQTGECEMFLYGGCDGNANNFMTIENCKDRCVGPPEVTCSPPPVTLPPMTPPTITLPPMTPPPVSPTPDICITDLPKWIYDPTQKKCIPYEQGECDGSEKLFDTEEQCKAAHDLDSLDICKKPPVMSTSQTCLASIPSWTYDQAQKKCVPYEYGGCGGTENLFDTEQMCQSTCDPASVDICQQPPVVPAGPTCLAQIPSWTYDPTQKKCIPYVYGGCGGTKNLFDTEMMCKSKCGPSQCNVCHQPMTKGPCKGYFEKFWFNSDTGVCEKFVYGGCQGNENNFETEQECATTCSEKQPMDNKI